MPEAPKLIRLPLGNVYRATERLVVCRISIVPLKLQLKLLLLLLLLVLLLCAGANCPVADCGTAGSSCVPNCKMCWC